LIERCPIIAILRGVKHTEVESIGAALEEAGVNIVEVPLNSPEPYRSIEILASVFGDRMLVGAGTLTDPVQVAEVANAGGRLIVTPHAELDVVRSAKQAGMVACPGFLNPTEAFALLKEGADAIKLFPAEIVGPAMLKALLAVLPKNTLVIPVGGIDDKTIPEWLKAGASGFGAGSSIYKPGDDAATVMRKATLLVEAVKHSADS
jgi:2-dehydro-3-deoxyphosphogalactonate aldolase